MQPCSRKLGLLGVLVVLMTAVGTLAYGQGAAVANSLFRIVADPSGASLPDVDVPLKNNSTVMGLQYKAINITIDGMNVQDNINCFGTTMTSPYAAASHYEVTGAYRDPTYTQDPGGRVFQVSWRVSFQELSHGAFGRHQAWPVRSGFPARRRRHGRGVPGP